jgi:hypothetical protein
MWLVRVVELNGIAFDASNGTLTPLAGSPFSAGNSPVWVAVAGTGK